MSKAKVKRRKRCTYCDELKPADEVQGGLCEECEDYHVYCNVCGKYIHEDSGHRHFGWVDGVGWCGCGAEGYCDKADYKESFFDFMDRLAVIPQERLVYRILDYGNATFDELMERFIAANNFWTFVHGFLMSTPNIDFRHQVREEWYPPFLSIRASDVDAMQEEGLALGWAWISSLDDETKAANKITVGWIREWRAARNQPIT